MRCLLTTTHTCSSSLLVCLSDLIGKLQVRCRLWSDAICMQVRAASNCLYHHHHHDHHQSLLQMYLGHFLADCATSPLFLLCLMDGTGPEPSLITNYSSDGISIERKKKFRLIVLGLFLIIISSLGGIYQIVKNNTEDPRNINCSNLFSQSGK